MDIKIDFSYTKESIHNLAFIKALLIKHGIEELEINYNQKEEIKNKILKEIGK